MGRSHDRSIVRCARPEPRSHLHQRVLVDGGNHPTGVGDEVTQSAQRDGQVEAPFFDRRTHHQSTVRPWHEVAAPTMDQCSHGAGQLWGSIRLESESHTSHRPNRRLVSLGYAVDLTRTTAGGYHHGVRPKLASIGQADP